MRMMITHKHIISYIITFLLFLSKHLIKFDVLIHVFQSNYANREDKGF